MIWMFFRTFIVLIIITFLISGLIRWIMGILFPVKHLLPPSRHTTWFNMYFRLKFGRVVNQLKFNLFSPSKTEHVFNVDLRWISESCFHQNSGSVNWGWFQVRFTIKWWIIKNILISPTGSSIIIEDPSCPYGSRFILYKNTDRN